MAILVGCSTFSGNTWPLPQKPITRSIEIIPISEAKVQQDGYYIDRNSAKILADNIDELRAYIKKLEILVGAMTKYHGDKTEEYKSIEDH